VTEVAVYLNSQAMSLSSISSSPASPCSPLFVSRSAAAGLVGSPPIHRGAIDPSEQLMRVSAPRAGRVSERTRLAHGTAARGVAMGSRTGFVCEEQSAQNRL